MYQNSPFPFADIDCGQYPINTPEPYFVALWSPQEICCVRVAEEPALCQIAVGWFPVVHNICIMQPWW